MTTASATTEGLVEVGEASEAFLEIVNANGVDCLFVMPGDIYPVLEAIAKYQALGKALPKVITTLHETVGLAAAHGHFMVSGRPQVCLFHVDVGVQMAGGMLHNAQRARAGVVICSGKTPMTFEGEMRGGRIIDVHWIQDRRDQASVVRDYTKWNYDLTRKENLPHVLQRAFQVAASDPPGPVYVSLLREMLLETMGSFRRPDPARHAPVRAGVPGRAQLEAIADRLLRSERPVIVSGYTGRSAAGFAALGAFALAAGVPVYVRPERANIASDNPMYLGTESGEGLAAADFILLLDVDVPWSPAFQRLAPGVEIAHIDLDPLKADIPVWGFPVDRPLAGDTALALPALQGLIEERATAAQRRAIEARRARTEAAHTKREAALAAAAEPARKGPISVPFLSRAVAELVDDRTIVVDDSTTARGIAANYMPLRNHQSYFQPMGSSMGWGSGAALGAKLAAPGKRVINLNSDGNFVSGAPEAALWGARHHRAPFLTVIYNNNQYAAIKYGLLHDYKDGYAARTRNFPSLDLPDLPDFARIAEACGAHGERVTDPAALRAALQRGMAAVDGGRAAVLDVQVAGP